MSSNTLRATLCSALLVLGLAGCGGSDAPKQVLSLKLDGKAMDFDAHLSANDPPAEAVVHFVTVAGHLDEDARSPGFGFQLLHADVQPGTYSTDDSKVHANYYVQNGNGGTTSYLADGSYGSRFVLTVSAMDEQHVEGSFSGVLRLNGGGENGPFLQVTNGRFSANYNGR